MEKIIKLAEKATGDNKDAMSAYSSYLELKEAIKERRKLEQTPITEEWLKEHGWLQNGMTQENLEDCDYENCDDTWCHPTEEVSIYIDYPTNKIMFCQDGNHEIWINNSLADLYDALELCNIKID